MKTTTESCWIVQNKAMCAALFPLLTGVRLVTSVLLVTGVAFAQVNAADFSAGVNSSILVPGSLATINNPNATAATVAIRPTGVSAPIPAQVTSITPNLISFLVPSPLPAGDAQLIYKTGDQATQWTPVSISPSNLTLFRRGPIGPLQAQNIGADGTPSLNGLANPAQPGQPVVLWGTGLGSAAPASVQITLGGVAQTVLYAGAAPGQPGLNQFNFRVAPGTPDGCYLPLLVKYGANSVASFLSKTSDGQPCLHPFGLSVDAMRALDSGASISTGKVAMMTGIQAASADRASRQESAQAFNSTLSAGDVATFLGVTAGIPTEPCSVGGVSGAFGTSLAIVNPFNLAITLQSATTTLTLPANIPPPLDSPLKSLPAPVIAGGKWTWNVSGGSSLAASSFDFVLPPPIQLSDGVPVTINRKLDRTITWDGSGFDANATLRLLLTEQKNLSPILSCSIAARVGSVTLPANLLSQFDAGAAGALSVVVSQSGPGVPHGQFKLSSGNSLLILITWSSTDTRPVDFQ
jgi:uncharacterized protein (TIGR03437 family)